jgi:hypothetical protein
VIGWIVLYRQSLAMRRREEMAQSIKLVIQTIDDILRLSKEYYSPANKSHISYVSAEIKGQFFLLSMYLMILKAAGMTFDVKDAVVRFKMLATGGHFETVNFLRQLSMPNWQEDLTYAGLSLRFTIERTYFTWCNQKLSIKALLLPS